ncbi:hypothetical protein M405DRAFT_389081 [Rhizopogon salebrosus TDB-379]|nr:hypothetical protein M405DRAFT_389081 [Rhizopogon salebrosus TDB-379]
MPHRTQARTWGTRFDTLLSSPSTQLDDANDIPQDSPLIANEACDDPKKSDRTVHDASIFIGSLPTNIEHLELARMLSDHLSGHPEVQTVKVVRDSKGGTCAFIQCQDAETAATLITNLHSSAPKHFMGRCLRYEPARALRTLIVSYRAPRQFTPSSDIETGFGDFPDGNLVEIDLPWAMKLFRVPGVRHLSVLYNSEARAAAENEGILPLGDREADDSGAYFHPLLYNAETLRKISTVFGGIEHFVPHEFESGDQQEYPPPHDAPRSTEMDTGCWEIKWRHRDDCVSALITLRRVPHLTVTWAHHPVQRRQSIPVHGNHHHWQTQAISSTHAVPSRLPVPNRVSSDELDALVPHPTDVEKTASSVSLWGKLSNSNRAPTPLCDITWTSQNGLFDMSTSPKRPRALSLDQKPLGVDSPGKLFHLISKAVPNQGTRRSWSDRMEAGDENSSLTPLPSMIGISEISSSPPQVNTQVDREEFNDTDIGIHMTPELGTSPVTPKMPGPLIPHTPTTGSYLGDIQSRSLPEFAAGGIPPKREGPLDPNTIFVGGLDMYGPNSWDEERVRSLFSRYGDVEGVKVIRPVNKRSAFAFVRFINKESSTRAISQEHNRIIDGRPIRVQLRDWNPQHRGIWKPHRNHWPNSETNIVGRDSEPSLVSRDDFRVDPSLQRLSMIATLEDRLQEFNVGEETVAKAGAPNVEQSEDKLDVSCSPLQPSASVADDAVTIKLGDVVSPPPTCVTPPGITQTPVTSASPLAYPMPTIGYYHPQGWVTGFPPYPMQYMGAYPGYPLLPPMSQSISPATDTHGTPSATPAPFIPPGAMYAPFIPYHPYPARTPVREQCQEQIPGPTQAPLIPTGFIHGDQGILVPVYPPDALNQYMSGVQGEQASASPGTPPPHPTEPPNAWRPYLPPAFTPHMSVPPATQHPGTVPFPMMGPQGWLPNQAAFGMHQHRQSPTNVPLGSNGAPMQPMFEQRGAPFRRQYRRGNHIHIKNGGRGQPGRSARGPAHFTGSQQAVQNASEWSQQ